MTENKPPIPSPWPDPPPEYRGKLVCPHCEHHFALTWKRYFTSGLGNHICPQCGGKSRLKRTPASWALTFLSVAVGGALPFILGLSSFEDDRIAVFCGLGAFVVGIPVDKYCDLHFSELVKRS